MSMILQKDVLTDQILSSIAPRHKFERCREASSQLNLLASTGSRIVNTTFNWFMEMQMSRKKCKTMKRCFNEKEDHAKVLIIPQLAAYG